MVAWRYGPSTLVGMATRDRSGRSYRAVPRAVGRVDEPVTDLPSTHVDSRGYPLLWSVWRNLRSGVDCFVVGRHPLRADPRIWMVTYQAETAARSNNQCCVEYFIERWGPVSVTGG